MSSNKKTGTRSLIIRKGTQLYNDMVDILKREKEGKLKFYTHKQVWGKKCKK